MSENRDKRKKGYMLIRKRPDLCIYKKKYDGIDYEIPLLEIYTRKGKIVLFKEKMKWDKNYLFIPVI